MRKIREAYFCHISTTCSIFAKTNRPLTLFQSRKNKLSQLICDMRGFSDWKYRLTDSCLLFASNVKWSVSTRDANNAEYTRTDGYGSLPKTIHIPIFVSFKIPSFMIVWPIWSASAVLSAQNQIKERLNFWHSQMPFLGDVLEFQYF